MSTILDALRKVERERDSSPDHALETPQVSPDVRRRRRFAIAPVVLWCAVIGFGGGAVLSWLFPRAQEVEVAALPVPPPPPAIPVPREPVRARPAPASAPVAEAKQETTEATKAPVAIVPGVPSVDNAQTGMAMAAKPAPAPVAAARPGALEAKPAEVVAALEKQGSALEPSPFSAPREPEREVAAQNQLPGVSALGLPAPREPEREAVAPNQLPKVSALGLPPRRGQAVPADTAADADIAALAPAPPALPDTPPLDEAGQAPEPEPEPEAPAETLVDTGRSPPGAPKVALSFLQWSVDPAKRFAFISVDGAPSQRVREGEVAAGLTVAAITKTGVQFKREGTSFMIRPRH